MLLAVATALALAGMCAPALAGTFDVRSCSANPAATPPTGPDRGRRRLGFETDDPAHLESVRNCPPSDDIGIDGLVVQDKLNSADPPLGRFAQWRFDAPAGTSLTRLRLWRYVRQALNDWELYTRTADGTKLTGSDCERTPRDPSAPSAARASTPTGRSTRARCR